MHRFSATAKNNRTSQYVDYPPSTHRLNQLLNVPNKFQITALLLTIAASAASGAILLPQAVSSGFNEDLIADGNTTAAASTSTNWDGLTNVLYSADFGPASGVGGGLPTGGSITSDWTGNVYQMADYSANNALLLPGSGTSGSLTLQSPGAFTQIGFLAAKARSGGAASVDVTLNFADNSTQSETLLIADWFSSEPNEAISGLGRVRRSNDEISGLPNNPRLHEYIINIDSALQNTGLVSIEFVNNSSTYPAIFARQCHSRTVDLRGILWTPRRVVHHASATSLEFSRPKKDLSSNKPRVFSRGLFVSSVGQRALSKMPRSFLGFNNTHTPVENVFTENTGNGGTYCLGLEAQRLHEFGWRLLRLMDGEEGRIHLRDEGGKAGIIPLVVLKCGKIGPPPERTRGIIQFPTGEIHISRSLSHGFLEHNLQLLRRTGVCS